MRVLVCVASYGVKNQLYLESILEGYRKISFNTKIIIVSDRPRQLGDDVEVKVGLPNRNPYSLPFAHKNVFFEKAEEFDLFIYSEDDIFISENNIKTFLELTSILPSDTISGFLRFEVDSYGKKFCPDAFSYFSWALNSVEQHGNELFAKFKNEHSAAYMLTRSQLHTAIKSGGYLVEPHEGDYDIRESAASDPYTQKLFINSTTNIRIAIIPAFIPKEIKWLVISAPPVAANIYGNQSLVFSIGIPASHHWLKFWIAISIK